ncbi:Uncharacterised protein [Sphingobacterium multivorum]|jgi:hypothetical protein|uniref:Uncharacterized protein n=2 Tax=Sphingobacterium TaxID=28453 RepID=A0A2X2JS43_SPHMU|nr:hypothetical protein [Sphingobacterium sp. BIGb0116]TWI25724.1 hypothetical protein IQ31_00293 [Sphingobacterium siyangense]SPZ94761.1 Uncharacterised protein [Sphingobacterium multivorum]SUJ31226.1 Uncharacterised protein [Sphingobacterium multivorum]
MNTQICIIFVLLTLINVNQLALLFNQTLFHIDNAKIVYLS